MARSMLEWMEHSNPCEAKRKEKGTAMHFIRKKDRPTPRARPKNRSHRVCGCTAPTPRPCELHAPCLASAMACSGIDPLDRIRSFAYSDAQMRQLLYVRFLVSGLHDMQ